MSTRLAIGPLAILLAACAPHARVEAPQPIKPEDGPKASLNVLYSGDVFMRSVFTSFRVERGAYSLVGHLAGDGSIRVLYPDTPEASGWVSAGKTIQLPSFVARYDAAPYLYRFVGAPSFRNLGSRIDSYDGRGHGFIFAITSRYPIDYLAIGDFYDFDVLETSNYAMADDPRLVVRSLADDIATGPYSIRFANSQSTINLSAFDSSRWHCFSMRQPAGVLGLYHLGSPGSMLLDMFLSTRSMMPGGCDAGYALRVSRGRVFTGGVGQPTEPLTPRLQRPTRRTLEEQERTAIINGRSSFDRRGTLSSRSGNGGEGRATRPRIGRTDDRDRTRASEGTGRTTTEVRRPERTSRPMDTPRMTTPAHRPTTTTTTTSSGGGGGETKAQRPKP